jgi:hypothetical protein
LGRARPIRLRPALSIREAGKCIKVSNRAGT